VPMLLQDRDAQAPVGTTARPSRRRRLGTRLLAAAVGVAVAVPLGGLAVEKLTGWGNPFSEQVVDRSTPALLLALTDLHQYHAATGTFQVVIDQERDTPWVPSVISGERTSLLATGTVDAYVDFTDLGPDRVALSADHRSATITLPAPELADPAVDPAQSRVLDRDRGIVQRVGDALENDTTDDTPLYQAAARRLTTAAAASDLRTRAEGNTRGMLTGLAHSLGVANVTVTFEPDPS
jgi:Protein of unknown function (DUF4230)